MSSGLPSFLGGRNAFQHRALLWASHQMAHFSGSPRSPSRAARTRASREAWCSLQKTERGESTVWS